MTFKQYWAAKLLENPELLPFTNVAEQIWNDAKQSRLIPKGHKIQQQQQQYKSLAELIDLK